LRSHDDIAAAILAGGLGSRLRSVISDRPKVLAPVDGVPFLSHLIRQLGRAQIDEAVLLVGYGANRVSSEIGERHYGVNLKYSFEKELLGTGGAVRLAFPILRGKSILLMNGDSYCNLDLRAFVNYHHAHGESVSLTLTWVDDASRYGSIALGPDDRITQFEEKKPHPAPGWINAGIYLIDRELFEEVPPNTCTSLERDLLPKWIARHDVFGFRGGEFIDIGVPESYAQASAFIRTLSSNS
jgi:D-glycero-alpha-D-manno-heptose 1-phosphate guanylyltransferase